MLVGFIKGMLYGIGKNKDGKEYSEAEKYKPWNEEITFSGAMEYMLNDKKYLLQRNFSSNSAKIFDEAGNDISSDFDKSKSRGLEIGVEQLGMDEETFESSSYIMQKQIDVALDSQNTMIQKLTNIIQSGNENQSYEKTKKKIEKLLYDEVGTNRTATKPKYICTKELEELENKKNTLLLNRKRKENIDERKKELKIEIANTNKAYDESKTIYNIKSKYEEEIQKEKLKFEAEKKAKEETRQKNKKEIKKRKIIDTILISVATITLSVASLIIKEYSYAVASFIVGLISIIINNRVSYKEEIDVESDNFDVVSEDIRKKRDKELKDMAESGVGNLYIEEKISSLKNIVDEKQKLLNTYELEEHKLKIEEESIEESLNSYNDITEQIQSKKQQLKEIEQKESIYNLALKKLDEAYDELRAEVVPELETNIKELISKTTNGMYRDIVYNDEEGLLFKNSLGRLEKINKLSAGTVDQMYIGFRLAIAEKYTKVPVVFDESFVYFDDERLENILKTLEEISEDRQVIILTCSSREKQALEKIKVQYNEVSIS